MDEERIVEIVLSNPLCRGVTFSGGEPFAQAEGFAHLAALLKEKGYENYIGFEFRSTKNAEQTAEMIRSFKL